MITMELLRARLDRLLARLGLLSCGGIHYISGSDTLPAPLSREEEQRLTADLGVPDRQQGARDRLI